MESEFWNHVREVKKQERAEKEPQRVAYAISALSQMGLSPKSDGQLIQCRYKQGTLRLWPYTGYWACKGLGSGRGINKLIKKLKGSYGNNNSSTNMD